MIKPCSLKTKQYINLIWLIAKYYLLSIFCRNLVSQCQLSGLMQHQCHMFLASDTSLSVYLDRVKLATVSSYMAALAAGLVLLGVQCGVAKIDVTHTSGVGWTRLWAAAIQTDCSHSTGTEYHLWLSGATRHWSRQFHVEHFWVPCLYISHIDCAVPKGSKWHFNFFTEEKNVIISSCCF